MLSRHKKVLRIAVPVTLNNLLHTMVIYTDFAMVSRLNTDAIVAVGLGMQVWGMFYATMSLIYTGQNALMSRFVGAGEYRRASMVISTLLIFVAVISLPVILFWNYVGLWVFDLFGASPSVDELAQAYLTIVFIAIPFEYVNSIFFTAFSSEGNTKTAMYITLTIVFLNALADYVLIFGHFGFAKMGVEGAAIATLVMIIFETIVFALYFLRGKTHFTPMRHFSSRLIKRVLRIGFPAMVDKVIGSTAMLLLAGMILALGTEVSAGFQLGLRIEGLAYMPGFGFAMAASVLMGQGLGAKDPGRSYRNVMLSLRYSVAIMFTVSILFIMFPGSLVQLFTNESRIIYEASMYLIIVAAIQIPLGVYLTLSSALKGAGDTKRTFWINFITMWVFRIIPGLVSVYGFSSIIGVYIGMVADPVAKAVIFWREFKKGAWKRLKI